MKVVGYTDRLSVWQGETIRFMVSSELPTYQADIVRLIHGDTNPDGPGFKKEPLKIPLNCLYPGYRQNLASGSYVIVEDHPTLRMTASFTLLAWIYPTTPAKGVQGVLTKWAAFGSVGYGLFLDHEGSLAIWLGDQNGCSEQLSTSVPLRAACWYFVAGAYDAQSHNVLLCQQPLNIWPQDPSRALVERSTHLSLVGESETPFLMGAYWDLDVSGSEVVCGHFNGKIDSPCLFQRALRPEDLDALRMDGSWDQLDDALVASWDFARDFSSIRVSDTWRHALHGRTVNMPARAMIGHNWTGDQQNFNQATDQYGAIHFHDDDLEDANWEVGFEFAIPEGLKSGVYAARLQAGDEEDYVPFFVRPVPGTASAPILFLVPTASYLAYGNYHLDADPASRAQLSGLAGRDVQFGYPVLPPDRYIVTNKLLSLYESHSDGSGVCYASIRRPILTMRPKYHHPALGLGRGAPHQLSADLYLVDWMEVKGYPFDVATDEDLHLEGKSLLARYRVVITGTHPEYWSAAMLDGLESYLANGGRLMYLGGNGFYWVTSFDRERPHVIEVRRWGGTQSWSATPGEIYHSTTGEPGGLWRNRGRTPQKMVGVGFTAQGFDASRPYRRLAGSFDQRAAFIFEGISEDELIGDFGLVMGGAGGHEIDRADPLLGTPPHALVLATVNGFSDVYQHVVEEVPVMDRQQGGTVNPLVRGDMVFFEGPQGGAVFSVGSIAWCGSLSNNHYNNNVSTITENVLRRFLSSEPL